VDISQKTDNRGWWRTPVDEREAIALLKQGNIDGLEALVYRHQDRALKTAYLVLHNTALAQDVVQDAFLQVHRGIGGFQADRPFEPWFLRIVVNGALKAASRQAKHISLDTGYGGGSLADLVPDPLPGPLQMVELVEAKEKVWAAVQRLSPAQRAIVVQRYYLGFTDVEIASGSGRAVGTVKHLLHRARAKLRVMLGRPDSGVDRVEVTEVGNEQR
jgi:RNA polymerase sigma-70 factor, ECF subfamily